MHILRPKALNRVRVDSAQAVVVSVMTFIKIMKLVVFVVIDIVDVGSIKV